MSLLGVSTAFVFGLAVLMIGLPVAAVLAGLGVTGGLATLGTRMVNSLGNVIWGVQNENLLTAIPLFILLGEILLRSGLADRMYGALSTWLARLPGGLLHSNIGGCALFAATCGSSVATAATIGTVALPALEQRGYSRAKSLGSIAAGGTLGILIPPSIAMLIYGSLTNSSVGKLFIAGIIPGILLAGSFMIYLVAREEPHF
jgi:C4-dicarboxylate transporter, DctM subunit